MKRIISNVMLVAAAAMTLFACQKQEINAPVVDEINGLTFTSEKPSFDDETKTDWTGSTIQWTEGDKIRVAYTCNDVWQNADGTSKSDEENGSKTAKLYESKGIPESGETALFSVPVNFKGNAEGLYEFYGIYPSSLVSSADFKYAPSATIVIPATQTPLADSFDSNADVMASKSQSYKGIPKEDDNNGQISLRWERLVAHGYITLKNIPVVGEEDIQTITLTADSDADMVGTHYLYLDTYNVIKPDNNSRPNELTIDARNLTIDENGNLTFWACFLPCTWTSVNVKVQTDKATYTRDINLSNNQKSFVKNARNVLGINMESAVRDVTTASPLPFAKDFSGITGTAAIKELDGFTVSGYVYNASGAIRLAKSGETGSITTKVLDLSKNFHVKVTASGWDSDEMSLTVTAGDQEENVALTAVSLGNSGPGECDEHIINFQPVSNAATVTFAPSANTRCYIKKIEILEGHAVSAPVLKTTAAIEIDAAGGENTFTYTITNPIDGQVVSAKSNVDWITNINVANNEVTYFAAENTLVDSRSGSITLSYEGAESVNVTITQAGKAPEGSEDIKEYTVTYTVSSTSAVTVSGDAPNGSSVSYSSTYTSKCQLTSGNSMTFKLSGYDGYKITGISLSMKSNSSKGAGNLSVTSGGNTIASIATANFNTSSWYGAWSTTYVDIIPTVTPTQVGASEIVEIKIAATVNSLYCQSVTVTYTSGTTSGGGNEGGETPDPTPDPEPEEPEIPGTPETGEPTTVTMTSFSATSAEMDSNVSYSTAKGGGTSEPAINSNQIRLYQNNNGDKGGSITITAKEGYKLVSVTIGSGMATSVVYTIDSTDSASMDIAKDGKLTVEDINESSITFHCMGKDKNSRLYVNYLRVIYQSKQ